MLRGRVSTAEPDLPTIRSQYLADLKLLLDPGSPTLVIADDRAAAALATALGLPALLQLGVTNVQRLGDAHPVLPLPGALCGASPDRILVLCSTFLPECYSALRATLAGSHGWRFSRFTIACSFSERAHAAFAPSPVAATDRTGDATFVGAYDACRSEVLRWPLACKDQFEVSVVHLALPAQLCPLGSSAFLLPADGVQPLLESDLPELCRIAAARNDGSPALAKLEDVLWSSLPAARRRALGGCAVGLADLLRASGIKPTLFTLGPTSLLLARELSQHLPSAGTHVASTVPTPSSAMPTASTASAAAQPPGPILEASVLLVDRSLDLVAPSLASDHPLDAFLAAANRSAAIATPQRASHPLSPPHGSPPNSRSGSPPLPMNAAQAASGGPKAPPKSPPPPPPPAAPKPPLPPALLHTLGSADPTCTALLDAILTRRGKEVGQQLLKTLATIADGYDEEEEDDYPGVDLPGKPTSAALRALLAQLQSASRIAWERLPELSAVDALLEASDAAVGSVQLGELVSHQKLLQHTASETIPGAFAELITLATRAYPTGKAPTRRGASSTSPGSPAEANSVTFRQLTCLTAMLYSLVGITATSSEEVEEHEQRLREALLQACLRDPGAGGLLAAQAPRKPPEELTAEELMARRQQLAKALDTLFERLHAFASARRDLGAAEALLLSSGQATGEVYRPLLRQLLERGLKGEDMPELHRPNSHSIGSLFSRGANLLGVKTRARLADHRTILIFVLGGISLTELRELRQLVAQHPRHRLLVGATQISSPDSVWDQLVSGLQVR